MLIRLPRRSPGVLRPGGDQVQDGRVARASVGQRAPRDLPEVRHPQELLGFRLPLLSNIWSALTTRRLGRLFGLKQLEGRVIFVIGLNGAVSLKYLGQTAGVEKAYASRVTASLVDAGLVSKAVDPVDRRSVRLELTASGRALYDSILQEAVSRDEEWIAVLSADEQRRFHDYLDRLIRRAHELMSQERSILG